MAIKSILYTGSLTEARNPKWLWEALAAHNIQLVICGECKIKFPKNLKVRNLGMVSHAKTLELQKQAEALLLIVNKTRNAKGILTGKLFEYLEARKPILAVCKKDSDCWNILSETSSGHIEKYSINELTKELVKIL